MASPKSLQGEREADNTHAPLCLPCGQVQNDGWKSSLTLLEPDEGRLPHFEQIPERHYY